MEKKRHHPYRDNSRSSSVNAGPGVSRGDFQFQQAQQQPQQQQHQMYTTMPASAAAQYAPQAGAPTAAGMYPNASMVYYDPNLQQHVMMAPNTMLIPQMSNPQMIPQIPAGYPQMYAPAHHMPPSESAGGRVSSGRQGGGGSGGRDRHDRGGRRDRNNNNERRGGGSEKQQPADLPCRTLFVRNVNYDTPESYVRELFSKFGEIKTVFSLLEKRGLVFITYFDLRAADSARVALNGSEVNGRKIDVHYSVPKDEDMQSRTCDGEKNQGTILLTLKDGKQPLVNEALTHLFSQYGDLKVVRDYKGHPNQRFIEYYDSRHCRNAVESCQGMSYNGGHLDLRYAWDTPHKYRSGEAQLPDRGLKRSRDRRDDSRQPQQQQPVGAGWIPAVPQPQSGAASVSLNHQAQQAQQMLAALTQNLQAQQIPQQTPLLAGGVPPVQPHLGLMNPTPAVVAPQHQPNVTPSIPVGTSPGTEALAQMNQLLQLLQQNPAVNANLGQQQPPSSDVSNSITPATGSSPKPQSANTTPNDPRTQTNRSPPLSSIINQELVNAEEEERKRVISEDEAEEEERKASHQDENSICESNENNSILMNNSIL